MNWLLEKRKAAKVGEEFGVGPYTGIKKELDSPELEQEDSFDLKDFEDNQEPNSSMIDQIKQKEDEEMEKKKLSFLGQQGGNKARYS